MGSIERMFVDYALPKPLRSNVKAPRSLRNDEQQQEHAQPDESHGDFSVPPWFSGRLLSHSVFLPNFFHKLTASRHSAHVCAPPPLL